LTKDWWQPFRDVNITDATLYSCRQEFVDHDRATCLFGHGKLFIG
jgi:hypothetical protein